MGRSVNVDFRLGIVVSLMSIAKSGFVSTSRDVNNMSC